MDARSDAENEHKEALAASDVDLAEEASCRYGSPGLYPATFRSLEHFRRFLKWLQKLGETHVLIDPGKTKVLYIPLENLLAETEGDPQ